MNDSTKQPIWKCVANLGDTTPWDYGGAFVLIDTTGVYTPELHIWEEPIGDEESSRWDRYVIILDQCTYINGILSDNKYHPECKAWFAYNPGDLSGIARAVDTTELNLIQLFCSEDPVERAEAHQMVYHYWGPQCEPDTFTDADGVKAKMKEYLRQEAE